MDRLSGAFIGGITPLFAASLVVLSAQPRRIVKLWQKFDEVTRDTDDDRRNGIAQGRASMEGAFTTLFQDQYLLCGSSGFYRTALEALCCMFIALLTQPSVD
jgi:hypothetical protein